MAAYYNEHDKFAAAWLRELIKAKQITDGEVDERDIQEVSADDVRGFTRCHFFAGIGGWDYALQLAGWPADRPVWTGSCPCQPFSSAGTRQGGADDRHLWPHWARLIRECRPVTIFGEQVESAIAHGWLDAVFDDLEREDYACGSACLSAASVGSFHIRQRLWFMAESESESHRTDRTRSRTEGIHTNGRQCDSGSCTPVLLADSASGRQQASDTQQRTISELDTASPWSDPDWLPCRDNTTRPVESGTFPLAHGLPARVGRLRGYGNAIVPQVAAEVIRAYMDIRDIPPSARERTRP